VSQVPYVFVSYSQESDDHVQRVLTVVQWLRQHGVEAYVDKFEQSPPESWQLWCYEQIQKALYVLVVCTETYERRVLRQEAEGVGRGATWEGTIITNELYDRTAGDSKFIPVVFADGDLEHVPFFLRGSTVYDVSDEDALTDLYRRLTSQPEYVPAPLGAVIDFPQAQLENPLPVVSAPPAPQPAVQPAADGPARLEDVIEGEWVVQIQNALFGTQMMRLTLTGGAPDGGQFQASAIVGPPGWQASGTWQLLPGAQIAFQGTQMVTEPFPQTSYYQTLNQFFSVTRNELHGMSGAQESVVWRRG
jgi:hypothetical protein